MFWLLHIFHLIRDVRKQAALDPDALLSEGDAAPRHAAYHWRIVQISAVSGAIFGVASIVGVLYMRNHGEDTSDTSSMWEFPLAGVTFGISFGAALACLFAPRAFLLGPIGQKWMRYVGVSRTATARFVCALVVAIIGGAFLFMLLDKTLEAHGILPSPKHPSTQRSTGSGGAR